MKWLFALSVGACGAALLPTAIAAQPSGNLPETSAGAAALKDKNIVDPGSLAVAREILAIAFPAEKRPDMYRALMQSIVDQTREHMRSLGTPTDKGFQTIVDRSTQRMFNQLTEIMVAALPDYFESMARAYARDLSRDDLNAVLAFVKTPAGQHYFERAPFIMKDPDVQAASQRMMAKVMERAPAMTRETRQELEAYLAKRSR